MLEKAYEQAKTFIVDVVQKDDDFYAPSQEVLKQQRALPVEVHKAFCKIVMTILATDDMQKLKEKKLTMDDLSHIKAPN
jgi:hypothetical protein